MKKRNLILILVGSIAVQIPALAHAGEQVPSCQIPEFKNAISEVKTIYRQAQKEESTWIAKAGLSEGQSDLYSSGKLEEAALPLVVLTGVVSGPLMVTSTGAANLLAITSYLGSVTALGYITPDLLHTALNGLSTDHSESQAFQRSPSHGNDNIRFKVQDGSSDPRNNTDGRVALVLDISKGAKGVDQFFQGLDQNVARAKRAETALENGGLNFSALIHGHLGSNLNDLAARDQKLSQHYSLKREMAGKLHEQLNLMCAKLSQRDAASSLKGSVRTASDGLNAVVGSAADSRERISDRNSPVLAAQTGSARNQSNEAQIQSSARGFH